MWGISSLINTCIIIYFLDSIWLKLVIPFLKKEPYLLKIGGSENNDNNDFGWGALINLGIIIMNLILIILNSTQQ